jgi:glycosyltransferase involved in cell wall biosynthesis
MKILHVIDSGGLYGAEVMLLNLMSEQVKLGLDPILASIGEHHVAEKPVEAEARRRGLRVKTFRIRPGPNFIGALAVLSFAWQEKVDLLHSHGYKGNILFGFMPKKFRRVPMVTTVHGWTRTGGINRMMVYEWLDSRSLAFIDRVVLVNAALKNDPRIRNKYALAAEVVNNGIPADYFSQEQPQDAYFNNEILDFCKKGYCIGAIGRLSQEKGFALLIEAIAELIDDGKDLRLVILGEGGLRSRLEKKIRELGVRRRVLMPGYVENAQNYLRLFDMFIISSLSEGLPIVLLEAMQAGVPIVATSVGGIPAALDDGRAGLLIEPGNVGAIKQGVEDIITYSEKTAERKQNALLRVNTSFSSKAMAEKYYVIYLQAVDSF